MLSVVRWALRDRRVGMSKMPLDALFLIAFPAKYLAIHNAICLGVVNVPIHGSYSHSKLVLPEATRFIDGLLGSSTGLQ